MASVAKPSMPSVDTSVHAGRSDGAEGGGAEEQQTMKQEDGAVRVAAPAKDLVMAAAMGGH